MRVALARDPALTGRERRSAAAARLGPLLRECGDRLGVAERASLAVRLTRDAELQELNHRYLGVDSATDVLAFPGDEPQHVGDVAISVERALQQAADGVTELRLLAVHGLLHCLGHDHGDVEGAHRMTELTRLLLPGETLPELQGAPPRRRGERWPH
jgi:probable rRNA maturation factor